MSAVARESPLCNLTYALLTGTVISLCIFSECFVPVDDYWSKSVTTFIMSETCNVCLKGIPKTKPRVCCNDCSKFSNPKCANLSTEELEAVVSEEQVWRGNPIKKSIGKA